jgi:photosystem II stability/assembly factor-like uncharacterized protein
MRAVFAALAISLLIPSIALSQYFWELKQTGPSLGGPIDVEKNNPDNVYYGSGNIIYKSTDGGERFHQLGTQIPNSAGIKNIILNDANPSEFLVAIENSDNTLNRILKTTDSGKNWDIKADSMTFAYFGIPITPDPTHPDTIYTMTDSIFMQSTNFGDTWDIINTSVRCADLCDSIVAATPCDIEVFPDTSIILVGDDGTGIFRSTDYGITWDLVHNTTGEVPTIAVDYQTPGVAYATRWGGGGGVLKSTDYGSTWILLNIFSGINMWGVHVHPNNSNYIIAGEFTGGVMHITQDGGNNWVSAATGSSNFQVYIVDTTKVFAAQGNGLWKLNSEYFIPVELISFTASVINNKIILNWSTASENNNHGFEIERSYDGENFFKIGFVNGSGTTTEPGGYTFTDQPINSNIYYRLKQIDFDGSYEYSSVVEVYGLTPDNFYLAQNHPNPFNPSTAIQFSLPVEASVTVKLFNMLGEELTEIVNQDFSAGIHTVKFTSENLSSGTYLYILKAAGINGIIFNDTRKMLLLK